MRSTWKRIIGASVFSALLVMPAMANDQFRGSHEQREWNALNQHQYNETNRGYRNDGYGGRGAYGSYSHQAQEEHALMQHQQYESGYGYRQSSGYGRNGNYGSRRIAPRFGISINIGGGRGHRR